MQASGRTRMMAQAYVWLTGIVTLFVFVQGGLIGAWLYKPSEDWTLDAHGIVGSVIGFVAIVPLLLAVGARFPRKLRLGWWTFAWALLWNIQAHILGFGIREDWRGLEIIHIPVALLLLAWGMVLAHTAYRAGGAGDS